MSAYNLSNGLRLVDLTKVPSPAAESRRRHPVHYNIGSPIPGFHTALDLITHLRTRCKCPYYRFRDDESVGELLLATLMDRAVYVNINPLKPNSHISAADLDRACGDHTKGGDIMILDNSWKFLPSTPATSSPNDRRLFINAESVWQSRNHKVKCAGFGSDVSIGNCNEDVKPFHDILMGANIVFLEVLKNLEDLTTSAFFMSYTPLPLVGADSIPVRAYVVKGLPGSIAQQKVRAT